MARKTLEEQIGNCCKHFSGTKNERCKAGVAYASVKDESVRPYAYPCLRDTNAKTTCKLCVFPTAEEVAAEVESIRASTRNINTARAAIIEKAGGRRGVAGNIICPVCRGGVLHFSIAGYNAHIHAQCTTKGCVSWME